MKTKTISFRKIMILSIFILMLTLFIYIALMSAFVSNTKKLSLLEADLISIQTNITQIEQELISVRRNVNRDSALENGFVSASQIAHIKIDGIRTAFLNE